MIGDHDVKYDILSDVLWDCLRNQHLKLTVDWEQFQEFKLDIFLANKLDVKLINLSFSVDQFLKLTEVSSFVIKGQRHVNSYRAYLLHFLSLFFFFGELGLVENKGNVILNIFQACKRSSTDASTAPASASSHKAAWPASALSATIEAHNSLSSNEWIISSLASTSTSATASVRDIESVGGSFRSAKHLLSVHWRSRDIVQGV